VKVAPSGLGFGVSVIATCGKPVVRSEAGDASARRILVHRIVAVIDVGTAILAKLDLERHAFASSQPPHILSHEQFGCRNGI
jgi:hypothetical protein